nr:hypothetical protein Itr_chr14CG11840 [Ipomoea trifida]
MKTTMIGPLFSRQCRSHSHLTLWRRSGGGGRRGREEAQRRRTQRRGEGQHSGGEAVERPVHRFQGTNVGDDNGETDIQRWQARNSAKLENQWGK